MANVVRDLMIREHDRGLSSAEKKMLNNAKQILISEICLSTSICVEEVTSMIEKLLYAKRQKKRRQNDAVNFSFPIYPL